LAEKKPKNGQYKRGKCGEKGRKNKDNKQMECRKGYIRTQAREKGKKKTYVDNVSM
jgi:hypothetical protein